MTDKNSADVAAEALLLPEEAAALLRVSAWWLKDQARRGLVPYVWVGGGYRFTRAQVEEIVRHNERRPTGVAVPATNPVRRPVSSAASDVVPLLRARSPRRSRRGGTGSAAA